MSQHLPDARQYAPATQRNRHAILEVLKQYLPKPGVILEIASGTGEHACFFAEQLAHSQWLPSDTYELALHSIEAWGRQANVPNLYTPLLLDVTQSPWPVETDRPLTPLVPEADPEAMKTLEPSQINGIVNINMIHISPWAACEGLFAGASRVLTTGGVLYLYGPFMRDGRHTAPSNEAFDRSLRSRNPQWGVRELEAVTEVAQQNGFRRQAVIEMPANNLSVIFSHAGSAVG